MVSLGQNWDEVALRCLGATMGCSAHMEQPWQVWRAGQCLEGLLGVPIPRGMGGIGTQILTEAEGFLLLVGQRWQNCVTEEKNRDAGCLVGPSQHYPTWMSSQGAVTPLLEPAEVLVRVWPSLEKRELLSGAVMGLSGLCGVQLWFPGHSRGCSDALRG